MQTENLLPESLESEKIILSNLLCDTHGEVYDSCSKLRPHHFLNRSHSLIFDAIRVLNGESKPSDLVSVTEALKATGKLEEVGGYLYLSKLFSSYVTQAHSIHHVEMLIEKHRLRKIIDICERGKIGAYANADSSHCLSELESDIFDLSENNSSIENQLQNACSDIRKQIEVRRKGGDIVGTLSGVQPFDEVFFGFQATQHYILAGAPSSGKTAMADQICGNLLMKDKSVLYISLESSRDRALGKIACKLAQVPYWNFVRNRINTNELDLVESILNGLEKKNLILMRPFDITPMELRPLIRKFKRREGIDLVIVDYLQKISMPSGWDERRTVSRASSEIQRACIETGVPSLVLCQLNRETQEGNRPNMRNLKESSQIEQDADNIAFIWSPTSKRDLPEGSIDFPCVFSVEKNKDGASMVDVEMNFELKKMIFRKKGII